MNKKKKIMIVEDDEDISKVYEIKFSKEGLDILTAKDGEEAISKISEEKPDFILLDLMIPKKDGFAVLEEIKKNPKLSKIPIVVLSNLGSKVDQKKAIDLGADEFLVKASNPIQTIIDKVIKYIK